MTTRHSPIQALQQQAGMMAIEIKRRLSASDWTKTEAELKIGIAMDDGVRVYKKTASALRTMSVDEIEDEIIALMQEKPSVPLR